MHHRFYRSGDRQLSGDANGSISVECLEHSRGDDGILDRADGGESQPWRNQFGENLGVESDPPKMKRPPIPWYLEVAFVIVYSILSLYLVKVIEDLLSPFVFHVDRMLP